MTPAKAEFPHYSFKTYLVQLNPGQFVTELRNIPLLRTIHSEHDVNISAMNCPDTPYTDITHIPYIRVYLG